MTVLTDTDLYLRGAETLLASWDAYARGATGAALLRLPGVAAAVFPHEPERSVYNNALLERDLPAAARADALAAMEAAYAAAGVGRFAAWVHESDDALRRDVERRNYALDTTTSAMGMALDDICLPRPQLDLAPPVWSEYLRIFDLPEGLIASADHAALHLRLARIDGETVASALAFDLDGDCGIYNVATLAHARRRGLATALTALQLHDARERGCRTASVQSTAMAYGVYAAVGFRDLGRFLEYVPRNRFRPRRPARATASSSSSARAPVAPSTWPSMRRGASGSRACSRCFVRRPDRPVSEAPTVGRSRSPCGTRCSSWPSSS